MSTSWLQTALPLSLATINIVISAIFYLFIFLKAKHLEQGTEFVLASEEDAKIDELRDLISSRRQSVYDKMALEHKMLLVISTVSAVAWFILVTTSTPLAITALTTVCFYLGLTTSLLFCAKSGVKCAEAFKSVCNRPLVASEEEI